jgi:carbamoyl-phosphate synthase large subunit
MTRVLVAGAGTAAGENLIRSLRAGDPSLGVVGCHDDRFVLKHSAADARYLVPPPGTRGFIGALRRVIGSAGIDLVLPTSDRHVQALSDARARIGDTVFLPRRRVVDLCHDKYALSTWLRRRGVAAPETRRLGRLGAVDALFAGFGRRRPLWCRPRTGTCARGGAAVGSPAQARGWIRLWHEMQGVPVNDFTLSEYLPGREILCQSLWDRGRMVLANTFERLSYFGVDNIPSGVTSLSSLAKTVRAPAAVELCHRAVRAVDARASGAFSIDVKEDARGRPHVTEINAGRLFMAMTAFDAVLKHNMALTWVRLARGERVEVGEAYDAVEDYYMVRDLDITPGIFHAHELFDGVEQV